MIFKERYATTEELMEFLTEHPDVHRDSIEITEDALGNLGYIDFIYKGKRYRMSSISLKIIERKEPK